MQVDSCELMRRCKDMTLWENYASIILSKVIFATSRVDTAPGFVEATAVDDVQRIYSPIKV